MAGDAIDHMEREALRILRDALDTAPCDRDSYVSTRCSGDAALRQRVEALLSGIAGEELASVDPDASASGVTKEDEANEDPLTGRQLGPFRVAERIGRGGMGIVYRGVREGADFDQQVAIKLIRRGFDFDDIRARFLRERRILARLSHPNLARFIDGGIADDGRPWFALEFVHGETITRWCDQRKLDIRARIRLFLSVCAAVQYAHTQLVVHRDLKPANVLVDETGAARLLDFGVAGLLAGDTGDETGPSTISECHAMTPEYAAPEQFSGGVVGIPADVYALGVLAYELVAGVLPYMLVRSDVGVATRTVAETPPQPLAAAITRAGSSVASATDERLAARRSGLRTYRHLVRGDLTRILDKALAKEPERRYATVQAFADDLSRWLEGAPVHVTGNRFGYRLGKFLRRNRMQVAFAGLALVLLLAGIGGVLWKSREALREAERAMAVKSFLLSLFDNNTPGAATDEVPSTRDLLARGVERVQVEMADEPLLRAEMLTTLGRIHNQLALYDAAEPLLRQALALERVNVGTDPLHQADTMRELAQTLVEKRQYAEAATLLRGVLALIGDHDVQREAKAHQLLGTVLGSNNQTAAGVRESEAALALFRSIEHPPGKQIADALSDLGVALMADGKFEQALEPQREALAIERRLHQGAHADVAVVASNIGVTLLNLGRFEEAVTVFEEAIAVDRKVYSTPHRALAIHLANLGGALTFLARTDEAATALRQGLEVRTELYGADNPETAKTAVNLAFTLISAEQNVEAETVLRRAIATFKAAPGEWRYWLALCETNLVSALLKQNRPKEARTELDYALSLRQQIDKDPFSTRTMDARALIGEVDIAEGRLPGARKQFEKNLADSLAHLPTNQPRLPNRYQELGNVNYLLGNYEQSKRNYIESLSIGVPLLGERSRIILMARLGLAQSLAKLGDTNAAREQLTLMDSAMQAMPESAPLRRQSSEARAALDTPSS